MDSDLCVELHIHYTDFLCFVNEILFAEHLQKWSGKWGFPPLIKLLIEHRVNNQTRILFYFLLPHISSVKKPKGLFC
jgi:hypothetical protein